MKITHCLIVGLLAVWQTRAHAKISGGIALQGVITRRNIHKPPPLRQGLPPAQFASVKKIAKKPLKTDDGCPEGFLRFQDSCFSQSVVPDTWESARLICQKAGYGGDLASINSKEEFDFVQRKFRGGKHELRWIGLRKEHPGTPYKWVNGDTAGYLPWVAGYTGQEPTGYAALSLINHNFLPKTSPNESLPFLCRTPTISEPSIAAAAVDAIQPEMVEDVGKGRTEEEMDTGGNTETLNACTEGWERFEGKCYKAFNEKKTFKDAIATCKKQGANLLSLNSPRESEFVRQQVIKEGRPDDMYWMGLSSGKNGYQWSDGSPLDYEKWFPGMIKTETKKKPAIFEVEDVWKHLDNNYCFRTNREFLVLDYEDCDGYSYFFCLKNNGDFKSMSITAPEKKRAKKPPPTTIRSTLTTSTFAPRSEHKENHANAESARNRLLDTLLQPFPMAIGLVTVNTSEININTAKQKSASADSESEDNSDQNAVSVFLVTEGSVVLMVIVLAVVSWHRQRGNFPFPWKYLQKSSSDESHNLQSVTQSLRDPETSDENQQGSYGAME